MRSANLGRRISRFMRWFSGLGLLLMTVIIGWQVFARYVLNDSTAWAESAAQLLMIWYVMFAAAAGVREGFHIRIGVVANALPGNWKKAVNFAAHAVVGLFGVFMAVWGTELMLATWEHVIPALNLPRGVAYMPIPLAGVLIFGFSIENIVADLHGREINPSWS
jgi:TRAP-type C4-dicarboxylate transport system permease small subunit